MFEEKQALAERLSEALMNDVMMRIRGTNLYAGQIAEALGLKVVYEE